MCRSSQRVYQPTSAAPAHARRFLVDHLKEDLAASVALEDAVLVVTELVTNALGADAGRIVVAVDLHRDHLLVAVTDDAPYLSCSGLR